MYTHKKFSIAAALMAAMLLAGAASAQDPEVGNVDDFSSRGGQGVPAASDFDYSRVSLRSAVWLDRDRDEVYQRGEEMGVGFQTNQDAYAVVYRIDAEGQVTVLWPRSRMDDGFVFGGHEYLLPVAGAKALRVSQREGEGFVQAVVSQYPFDLRDLQVDFHHEPTVDRFQFMVAGDPYLAMNEVNFAVTGLEDSEEFVVTNHTSYYVHRQVDHPRYLCNQCHVEEETAYNPYRDECVLDIQYDYGWTNEWYGRYGYYPVYVNPVYVYVDPWTYRPWVNWWYYPSYVCAPTYGWGWSWGASWGPCYSWYYSPYYRGDSWAYASAGHRRYQPLNKVPGDGARTKTREYGGNSSLVSKDRPDARTKQAMRDRTALERASRGTSAAPGKSPYRGVDRTARSRQDFSSVSRVRGNPGLKIRDGAGVTGRTRANSGSGMRHTAAGADSRATLAPGRTRGSGTPLESRGGGGSIGSRSRQVNGNPGTTARSRSGESGRGSIKTVEPRKKGTRIWNTRGTGSSSERKTRSGQVRPGSSSGRKYDSGAKPRSGSGSVKRTKKGSSGSSSRQSVKPRPSTGSRKSPGGSSTVRSRSGGGSKSSGTRSSGGSRSGGDSRSKGSRSGGRR